MSSFIDGEIYEVEFSDGTKDLFVVHGKSPHFGAYGYSLTDEKPFGRCVFDLPEVKLTPVLIVAECSNCGEESRIPVWKDYLCEDCRESLDLR